MPIYEYECDKCGHAFEREQRISDPPIKSCPKCKGRKVTKLISQTSFVLKGGGWYADGYSDSKGAKAKDTTASADSTTSSDTSSSPASSTESKTKSTDSDSKTKSKPKAKGTSKSAA